MSIDTDELSAEMRAELAALEAIGEQAIGISDAPEMPIEQMLRGRRRFASGLGLPEQDAPTSQEWRASPPSP